jgi:hypothetical protein
LDFDIASGADPCSSNLTLNSVPLESDAHWNLEPKFIQGSAAVNASGHELGLSWFTACNSSSDELFGAQLLTVNINSINGTPIDQSQLAGFTLTFKDTIPTQLLRYILRPISPADIDPLLYIPSVEAPSEDLDFSSFSYIVNDDPGIVDNLKELRRLKAERLGLDKAISDKQIELHDLLSDILGERIHNCEGPLCKFKAVFTHIHTLFHVYFKTGARQLEPYQPALNTHRQIPTMISKEKDNEKCPPCFPAKPEECHCREPQEEPTSPPPTYDESGADPRQFRDAVSPSTTSLILRFFFTITGLALLFALVRRCCGCNSPRRRQTIAERRERRRREKQYRRASKRQAFWDWMKGRKRGTPGRRVGDLEEKARLVGPQEAMLEQRMQDEISQLKIHEEIAQIRSTRDVVDDLIRAEEGRIVPPSYSSSSSQPVPAGYTGFAPLHLPRPIAIPPRRPSSNQSDISSPTTSSDMPPFSPASRTTSLPSYRSKPPSYREDVSSNDGFSDADLSIDEASENEEAWGSGSSVPDLSPRPSGDTMRTYESARTFESVKTFL